MPQDLFSSPPGDDEEPDSYLLPPAADGIGPEGDWDGPAEQGLYVCLPAEQLTLAGFAQDGQADTMAPGPLLATVVHTVTGEDGAEVGYHPSHSLRHIIRARNARCTAPGCTRPAASCDLDHTVPWDQGGLTCECDLAPPCKR